MSIKFLSSIKSKCASITCGTYLTGITNVYLRSTCSDPGISIYWDSVKGTQIDGNQIGIPSYSTFYLNSYSQGSGNVYVSKNTGLTTIGGCLKLVTVPACSGTQPTLFLNSDGCVVSGASSGGGLQWTGSTNNGVGTYSSSGTICSEPNLTFNGSALAFDGTATRYICMGVGNGTLCICGAGTDTTKAGDIKIEAGKGFTTTGGTVCIIAGQGDVHGRVALVQNNVERLATTTTGIQVCGNVSLATGAERIVCFNAVSSGVGSQLTILGNQGASTSVGGAIVVRGGCGGSTSGTGGAIRICGGGGNSSSTGGAAYLIGGNSSSGTAGAAIICGGSAGGGTGGDVCITGGYGSPNWGNVSISTGADTVIKVCYNGGATYATLYYNSLQKLYTVTNGVCVTGCGFATDFIASSDCRLKTNIQPISNALSIVNQLCGVCYNMCDDELNENRIGLIAQEVKMILPEVISHSQPSEEDVKYGITDEKLGLKYDKLTAVLIEAVKEQQKQINELKLEIEKLKTC